MRKTYFKLPGRLALLVFVVVFVFVCPASLAAQNTIIWQQTGGPSGGKVNVLAVDPTDIATVYAGTTNGVYVSHDGGDTWRASSNGMSVEREVQALVVNPLSPEILYAGTTRDGIYRSLDGGASWYKSSTGLTRDLILSLAIAATRPDTLYAGVTDQVFKTTNGGRQWVSVSMGLEGSTVWSLAVDPVDPDVVYAGTSDGVYKSTDGGLLWNASNEGLPPGIRVQVVTINPKTPDVVYIGTDAGVYRSDDGAQRWVAANRGLAGRFVRAVVVDPVAPVNTVYAAVSRQGLYKSTDSGQNWTLVSDEFADKLILTLTINPLLPTTLLAGTGRGVFRSDDGGMTWVAVNQGLTNTVVRLLAVDPQRKDTVYAGTEWGVFKSTDAGDTWVAINQGLADTNVLVLSASPERLDTLYVGIWSSQIYRSDDGGLHWQRVTENLVRDAQITALVVVSAVGEADELYAGTNGGGVFHSSDGGATWAAVGSGLPNPQVQTLALAPGSRPTLYAGTGEGLFWLDLSSGDARWQSPESGLPGGEVWSIVVDHRHPSTLYVALSGGGMFRSLDAGRHWVAVSDGSLPTNLKIQTLAINPKKTEIVYAGTDGGVFKSLDQGNQWLVVNTGLPARADIQALAIGVQQPTVLYAGTNGSGVYRGVDHLPNPFSRNVVWGAAGLAMLAGLMLVAVRLRRSRALGSPQATLESNWPMWEACIEEALMQHGRVEADMVPTIPLAIRAHALHRYMEEHPEYDLVFQPQLTAIELSPPRQRAFKTFLHSWKAAWEMVDNEIITFQSIASITADQLCAALGFTRLDSRSYKSLHGFIVKAPAIRLRVPPRFPIIFLQQREYQPSDINDLRDFMGILNMTSYFALLVDLNDADQARPASNLRQLVDGVIHDFIVLNGRDLRRILMAKDPEHELIEIILGQVDLTVVSPYVISGPVPENMFFGRDNELKTITRRVKDSSFALVGGRKIGKTSILAKVYRLLADVPDHFSLYLDCQTVADYDVFFEAVGTMWDMRFEYHSVDVFRRMITDLAKEQPGEKVIILLDEVDALLKYDALRQEPLFRVFRAMSQEGYCRFVFCGERILNARLHDPKSPLFNFCDVIRLSYLHPQATHRIILEPMREMGITFESEVEMVERIMSVSSCHPNIVQYICQKLIVEINARGDRAIALKDLDVVTHSSEFYEYFLEVTWGNTTPLERIITLLMINEGEVTLTRVDELLQRRGISVSPRTLEQAIEGLLLYSIIKKDGQTYAFASAGFPRIVKESQDIDALLDGLKQSLGRN